MRKTNIALFSLGTCLLLLAACTKKVASVPPQSPSQARETAVPPKPVISLFTATPSSVERGQSSGLRWSVDHATSITIEPDIGPVQAGGNRQVFPANSTTYTLTAIGPGGKAAGSALIRVMAPAPRVATAVKAKSMAELLASVQDAYFDYDKANLRGDARTALTTDATTLKGVFDQFHNVKIVIEGNCDERGSAEYNLALGDRRATEVKDFLTEFGVPATQLRTISYGKERPVCTAEDEECWQKNRRAHVAAGQ